MRLQRSFEFSALSGQAVYLPRLVRRCGSLTLPSEPPNIVALGNERLRAGDDSPPSIAGCSVVVERELETGCNSLGFRYPAEESNGLTKPKPMHLEHRFLGALRASPSRTS